MRRVPLVASLVFGLVACAVSAADLPWTQLGPFDSLTGTPILVGSLVVVPGTATLYASGAAGAGVFRSDDGGGQWVDLGRPGGQDVLRLYLDPSTSGAVYAATYWGLYRTRDRGATWTPSGLQDQVVNALAVDPQSPNTVYAGTVPQHFADYGYIFKSLDAGASWSQVDALLYDWVISLAVDPLDPSTIFAGSSEGGTVFRSTDGGGNWTAVDQPLGYVHEVAVDPRRPGVAYFSWHTHFVFEGSVLGGTLRRTTDGGATWSDVAGLPKLRAGDFLIDPRDPSLFYFESSGSLFRSIDGGQTWGAIGPAMGIAACDSRYLYAISNGVLRYDLSLLPPTCEASSTTLCLQYGRFSARVDWQQSPLGPSFQAQAVPLTTDSGYFWFFGPDNVELVVKVLDGTGINGDFWVFYGALSDVAYRLTVTDSLTGATREYVNPQGTLASVADTHAFPGAVSAAPAVAHRPSTALVVASPEVVCIPDPAALCLEEGRFQVRVDWRLSPEGPSFIAPASPLTGDTGYFWFFNEANVELVVKVLDGTAINGHYWVFYGALSDVQYTITVTDTQTGATQTYENARGTLASVADTKAF